MIVEMPFIQRYVGRTKNLSDIRQLAAWDRERVQLADHSLGDFDIGSQCGDGIHTLYRDGSHWAYFGTSVTGKLDYHPLDTHAIGQALWKLAEQVDMTRLLDGGRVQIRVSGVPHDPPDPKWTHHTERDLIVPRLIDWVGENVITIDGNLAVRVGEPSVRVRISPDDAKGMHELIAQRAPLVPIQAVHAPGLHFSLQETDLISGVMASAVADCPHLDGHRFIQGPSELASMTLSAPVAESMHERSLISMVHDAVSHRLTGRNAKSQTANVTELTALLMLDDADRGEDELERMAEVLNRLYPNLEKSRAILTEIMLTLWQDRPIEALSGPRPASQRFVR